MVKENINQEGVWRFGIKSRHLFKRQNGTQKGKLYRAVSCSLKLATLISMEAVAALQSATRHSVKSDKQAAVQGWNHQRRQVLQHYKGLSLSNRGREDFPFTPSDFFALFCDATCWVC